MADYCLLDRTRCLNNGKCVVNISSNTTYCQCGSCYDGVLCEAPIWQEYDTDSTFLIIYVIQLLFSIVNNGLVLELFICSRRLRNTNAGVYLMAYSILSFHSSMFLPVHELVKNYRKQLGMSYDQYVVFRCFVHKIGYNALVNLCILLSSCIAFERSLTIFFGSRRKTGRWRLCTTLAVIFVLSVATVIPFLVYKCNWQSIPSLQTARLFFSWFYIIAGIAIYMLTILLVLISLARRIRRYGLGSSSYMKTFLKLLYTHLFVLLPPTVYVICQLPYTISYETKNPHHPYYRCGIPTVEYLMKVSADVLTGAPIAITWLLFVYPSRVYMTEFYLNTWTGPYVAEIVLLFKLYQKREESNHSSPPILINNEHYPRRSTLLVDNRALSSY